MLHVHGSGNPLGVTGNIDRQPMHPYFIFKDLVTILLFFLVLSYFVFYMPNVLGSMAYIFYFSYFSLLR